MSGGPGCLDCGPAHMTSALPCVSAEALMLLQSILDPDMPQATLKAQHNGACAQASTHTVGSTALLRPKQPMILSLCMKHVCLNILLHQGVDFEAVHTC
jgi:hypothetical protein